MNKKNKIIIISLITICIIVFIAFLILKFDIYILKITNIDKNSSITAVSSDNTLYFFNYPDLIFNKEEDPNLGENDIIFVLSMPPDIIPDVAFSTIDGEQLHRIYSVKLMFILKNN